MVQQPLMPIAAALKLKASRTSQSTTVETIASRAEAAPCNVAYSSGIKAVMTAEKSASYRTRCQPRQETDYGIVVGSLRPMTRKRHHLSR